MSNTNLERVDEISKYYKPVEKLEKISQSMFWVYIVLSFVIPYSDSIFGIQIKDFLQIVFLVFVLGYFGLSQVSSLYYLPRAEFERRKQLLSDSFEVPLSSDNTQGYYNNNFVPSTMRLGANTMENAFFSQAVSLKMLEKKRVIIVGYIFIWVLVLMIRSNSLETISWITQLVFSGEILIGWLKLEIFNYRCKKVYDELHQLFLLQSEQNSPNTIATLLHSYATYESAKSEAGISLSTKIFNQLNNSLSTEWMRICDRLSI